MVSNPLIWMEMSGLSDEQVKMLSNIISAYKKERPEILKADITPIGERPDGTTHTGFNAETKDGGYLILLKEKSDKESYSYTLRYNICDVEVLTSNCPGATLELSDNKLIVSGMNQSGYVFVKYKKL